LPFESFVARAVDKVARRTVGERSKPAVVHHFTILTGDVVRKYFLIDPPEGFKREEGGCRGAGKIVLLTK